MLWQVSADDTGQSLQEYIYQKLQARFSKKSIKKAIENNQCRLNSRLERFANTKLLLNDLVDFQTDSQNEYPRKILYEDNDLLIIDKYPGMVCEPKGLPLALASYGYHGNAQLVHRLDKETTGVLLLAKSKAMLDKLEGLFYHRQIHKQYLALVAGKPRQKHGVIKNFLTPQGLMQGQKIWGIADQGNYAETRWEVLETGCGGSLVGCEPLTGRTHQIRVHLASLGCPIIGDGLYGKGVVWPITPPRLLLHASSIQFEGFEIRADIPQDFTDAWNKLTSCKS